tara:strand:- start:859 stop:1683 length:825 start_codon:yes stop_codon:yes gene_type:complete
MFNSKHQSTEDKLISLLLNGEHTVAELFKQLNQNGHKISLQAVYDAIRQLVSAGVVIKQSKLCSLDAEWRIKTANILSSTPSLPEPLEGEAQTFNFNSFNSLDTYWKHINALLTRAVPDYPVFYFVSHEFWVYQEERKESQLDFIKQQTSKRSTYILIGGTTQYDKIYKERFRQYRQIELSEFTPLKRHEHLTVCGDFVIFTKITKTTSELIDKIYQESVNETELTSSLQKIFTSKQKTSLVIKRDASLAIKLRKQISKNMYLPKEEREKWKFF